MEISQASLTIALKKPSVFISAFPGLIIFGTIESRRYQNLKCFKFPIFFIHKFFNALSAFYFFLSNLEETVARQGLILQDSDETEAHSFWQGHICINGAGENLRSITFGVEFRSEVVYKVDFSLEELNNLIEAFKLCVPFTIFYSNVEFELFQFALTYRDFQEIRTSDNIANFITIFEAQKQFSFDEHMTQRLKTLLQYYKSIIQVARNLEEMIFNEN